MIEFAHIGLQKTGSTWLRYGIFDQHPELEVFGHIVKGHRLEKPGYLVQEIYDPNFDKERWLQALHVYTTLFRPNRIVGISNEQLSGHAFDTPLGLLVADRLHKVFGDIKIILVLRNPVSFIESAYVQAIKSGTMTLDFDTFLGDPKWHDRVISRVDYLSLVNKYRSLYSHFLVLPYELVNDDAQLFLDHICSFLNITSFTVPKNLDKNSRMPFTLQEVMRRTNKLDLALWPRRRYISRALKHTAPLLSNFFPIMNSISVDYLRAYGFECFHADHYRIWDGELSKYNYFQTELNS
jgi:hypothetical protein